MLLLFRQVVGDDLFPVAAVRPAIQCDGRAFDIREQFKSLEERPKRNRERGWTLEIDLPFFRLISRRADPNDVFAEWHLATIRRDEFAIFTEDLKLRVGWVHLEFETSRSGRRALPFCHRASVQPSRLRREATLRRYRQRVRQSASSASYWRQPFELFLIDWPAERAASDALPTICLSDALAEETAAPAFLNAFRRGWRACRWSLF